MIAQAPRDTSRLDGGRAEFVFDRPQAAIAPGPAVVFYDIDVVVGGGWIDNAGSVALPPHATAPGLRT